MTGSTAVQSALLASRLPFLGLAAFLFVGCEVVPPRIERDELYSPDWPDTVGSGENRRGIEGTFENKGVLVEEKHYDRDRKLTSSQRRLQTALLSDMFRSVGSQERVDQAELAELQRCERVSLSVEPYSHLISNVFGWRLDRLMLSIRGSQPMPSVTAAEVGPCATTLRVEYNECREGVFVNRVIHCMWAVEVGRGGSLVVDRRLLHSCDQLTCTFDRVIGRFNRVR